MPKKPVKWGIKGFSLTESSNGYILNVLLYTGAETLDETDPRHTTLPQPVRVVMHLFEPYLHKGYHVFTDRYYSSIPLAHNNQTAFTGTIQHDRVDLPDCIQAGETPREGEGMAFRNYHLMARPIMACEEEC